MAPQITRSRRILKKGITLSRIQLARTLNLYLRMSENEVAALNKKGKT